MFLSSDISLHYLRSFGTPVTPYSVSISLSSLTLAPSDLRPPTSVLRTLAYSLWAWTSDLRPLGPPQIEGTDGVSGRWLITSPKPSPVSAELWTRILKLWTPCSTVLTLMRKIQYQSISKDICLLSGCVHQSLAELVVSWCK